MTIRVLNLEFSGPSAARLEVLKQKMEADDFAEVIRKSLQLYEALIQRAEDGDVYARSLFR